MVGQRDREPGIFQRRARRVVGTLRGAAATEDVRLHRLELDDDVDRYLGRDLGVERRDREIPALLCLRRPLADEVALEAAGREVVHAWRGRAVDYGRSAGAA